MENNRPVNGTKNKISKSKGKVHESCIYLIFTITMGIGTVLSAKRIILLAWGINKSDIVKQTIEGTVSANVPATYLQQHENTTFILDKGGRTMGIIMGPREWDGKKAVALFEYLTDKYAATSKQVSAQ